MIADIVSQAMTEKLLYYTLFRYRWRQWVGMPKLQYIEENVQLAKRFTPVRKSEMERISATLSIKNEAKLGLFFSTHVDA